MVHISVRVNTTELANLEKRLYCQFHKVQDIKCIREQEKDNGEDRRYGQGNDHKKIDGPFSFFLAHFHLVRPRWSSKKGRYYDGKEINGIEQRAYQNNTQENELTRL